MGIQWDCEVIAHDMTASVCELRLPSFFRRNRDSGMTLQVWLAKQGVEQGGKEQASYIIHHH